MNRTSSLVPAPAVQSTAAPATSQPSPSASAADDPSFAVPGYRVGEIPPVPLFALPDLGLLTASTGRFTPDLTTSLTSRPGITVTPARCDEQGVLAGGSTVVGADGSVVTNNGQSSVVNDGRGAGLYTDGTVSIVNNGDGTSNYADGALFDFGSSEVRPEAAATLTELAQVLNEAGAPRAHVYGHTDSVSDEAFNQTLSEQRAQAVVDALTGAGATTSLDAQGFGETRPVAPNENPDGSDDPAGRQLNRRVEIYIPAF